jgi:hypothetical protein
MANPTLGLLLPVLLVACGPTARVQVPPTHPASPQAEESPVPPASTTLHGPIAVLPPPASGGGGEGAGHHHDAGPASSPAGKPAGDDHSRHREPATPSATAPADGAAQGHDHSQHQKPGGR